MSIDTSVDAADDPTSGSESDEKNETVELDTEEKDTIGVDHGLPQISSAIATIGTLIGVGSTASFNLLASPLGLGAIVVVIASMYVRRSRRYFSLGVGLALLAATVSVSTDRCRRS